MPRHKIVDGLKIMFTVEEETARDAKEVKWLADKPMKNWLQEINDSDGELIPRYLEDLITDNPSLTIHEKMKKRYDDKVALRATKP